MDEESRGRADAKAMFIAIPDAWLLDIKESLEKVRNESE
jgi:hypothetical protein